MRRLDGSTEADCQQAARFLCAGKLVAIPTETVYGLAANGLDESAVQQIFEVKGRPAANPLILHVVDLAAAERLGTFSKEARKLAEAFWPGPLTLVVEKTKAGELPVPEMVTAGQPTLALRSPAHPVTRQLLAGLKFPLAAPSANRSGYVSPTTAAHVFADYGADFTGIAAVLDGGPCKAGLESTILFCPSDGIEPVCVLREGPISRQRIEQLTDIRVTKNRSTGPVSIPTRCRPADGPAIDAASASTAVPSAPGTAYRHYSPRVPVIICKDGSTVAHAGDTATGWVFFDGPSASEALAGNDPPKGPVYVLSETGDGAEAASRLYGILRALDEGGLSRVYVQSVPASAGDWRAVLMDRIQRAAAG